MLQPKKGPSRLGPVGLLFFFEHPFDDDQMQMDSLFRAIDIAAGMRYQDCVDAMHADWNKVDVVGVRTVAQEVSTQ